MLSANKIIRQFLFRLLFLAGFIGGGYYLTDTYLLTEPPHDSIWVNLVFFVVVTFIFFMIAYRGATRPNADRTFTTYLLGAITVKFFISMVFMLIYVLRFLNDDRTFFLISFVVLYLVFTILGVKNILKINRSLSAKRNEST